MAGERILIVDDTPVNLKLTRLVLANEGFTVSTAGSAEEALNQLPAFQPRLILADIQLPGIDGLEMTRRIKQDPGTRDIIVIALTAFAMLGDESRAVEAGCEGYITKPIDTRTLGSRIREVLALHNGHQAPAAEALPSSGAVQTGELQALRRRFLDEGQQQARRLLVDLDGLFDAAQSARAVHQWVGTGGLLGYPDLSRQAREIEHLLRERPLDSAQVRESLTNLLLAFTTPPEAIDAPVPPAILEALSGQCVAVAGLPGNEARRLSIALERAHARPVFFDRGAVPSMRQLAACRLVAAYVAPGSAHSPWFDPETPLPLPVVLIGNREDLLGLDSQVQDLSAGFLMDSWQPEEALVRLAAAVNRPPPVPREPVAGPVRVIVADPDVAVRDHICAAVRSCGVDVDLAADGAQALESIRRIQPQAAILGAALPGLGTYAVLDAVRAGRLPVRVMLLADRHNECDVIRGFALGADDYIAAPFSPHELIARLERLLVR